MTSLSDVNRDLKENVDNQIPVLVSFESSGGAHIRTLMEYTENEFFFFDPGDCQLKRFNYQTSEFLNALRGSYRCSRTS